MTCTRTRVLFVKAYPPNLYEASYLIFVLQISSISCDFKPLVDFIARGLSLNIVDRWYDAVSPGSPPFASFDLPSIIFLVTPPLISLSAVLTAALKFRCYNIHIYQY